MSGRTLANWRRWLPSVVAAVLVFLLSSRTSTGSSL